MSDSDEEWSPTEFADESFGWLLAEAQILYGMFWGVDEEVPPVSIDRYVDKSRQMADLPEVAYPRGNGLFWVKRILPLVLGPRAGAALLAPRAGALMGSPGDFPLQNGVNLDITTGKWSGLGPEDQLDLFTRLRSMPECGEPPTRDDFEAVGIRIIDDFE